MASSVPSSAMPSIRELRQAIKASLPPMAKQKAMDQSAMDLRVHQVQPVSEDTPTTFIKVTAVRLAAVADIGRSSTCKDSSTKAIAIAVAVKAITTGTGTTTAAKGVVSTASEAKAMVTAEAVSIAAIAAASMPGIF